jgi:hypothetical protein
MSSIVQGRIWLGADAQRGSAVEACPAEQTDTCPIGDYDYQAEWWIKHQRRFWNERLDALERYLKENP